MSIQRYIYFLFFTLPVSNLHSWGFFAHQKINEVAVFSLPKEMIVFYKAYLTIIKARAVNADKRRYVVEGEAPRHYIDMEYYAEKVPSYWSEATKSYTKKEFGTHGMLPWHIIFMMQKLTAAFKRHDIIQVIKYSADIGHYVADACVPLHTTQNYDGQYTGQQGIHALWESRLPELFAHTYDLFVGKCEYIQHVYTCIWDLVQSSNSLVEKVLAIEKKVDKQFPSYRKYCFEKRGVSSIRKMHAREYAAVYHEALQGMVEKRMRKSILTVASVWYTCWVNAGEPDLSTWVDKKIVRKKLRQEKNPQKKLSGIRVCEHEAASLSD